MHPSPWMHRNLRILYAFLTRWERSSPGSLPYSRALSASLRSTLLWYSPALTNACPFDPLLMLV